jgi:hypothetical protein
MRKGLILLTALVFTIGSYGQLRKTPTAVTTAFEKQYPNATKVQYEDNLLNVQVYFVSDSGKMIARYGNDGVWKESERTIDYETVPADIKTGFDKSKYAVDWKLKESAVIYVPNNEVRYRLKVEKNDLQKKYLFFDKNGRLLKDSITI